MTDGDRREIAHIVKIVLDERIRELETSIAEGFVAALECFCEDLAKVLGERNDHVSAAVMDKMLREERREQEIRNPVGFIR